MWMPSLRAPFVVWLSSFLSLGVTFFSFAGVGIFGLLEIHLILRVFVQEGLVARQSGPLRENPFGELLPVLKVVGGELPS